MPHRTKLMKRNIIIVVLVIIAGLAWYGYREWNRTNKDLKGVNADHTLQATELIAAFEKDSASSNRKYLDDVLSVSGNVKSIDREGNPVVISLGEGSQMSSVQCSMDSTYAADYKEIEEGDQVSIKGLYIGYLSEELFGTDVKMNRCVISKK